ncbi:transaldolase [Intestinibaculum porci]|uniref:Transaldolase n=1 Tax=Intestinibaculum porci TaxID=2487118 RepID=A0A3G9J444_9FIRM|nr:fructose-6-phosphate aldolase [Intestinibaculum porci]BBH25930.1 transaldolase [Intestinibaculum porci]
MEFILDTINLEEIRDGVDHMPIVGITSNPSIVKKTSPKDFFGHMRQVREIIGMSRCLHVQIVATKAEDMIAEAHTIFKEIDDQVYIKVPTSYEGVKAMKALKAEGANVTATAVYTTMQAYMALEAGADYLAPYFNRIANLGGDPVALISNVAKRIEEGHYDCKILAASFHALSQVEEALNAGSQAVTAPYGILKTVFANPNIDKAVNDFNSDWYDVYGQDTSICDLAKEQ